MHTGMLGSIWQAEEAVSARVLCLPALIREGSQGALWLREISQVPLEIIGLLGIETFCRCVTFCFDPLAVHKNLVPHREGP